MYLRVYKASNNNGYASRQRRQVGARLKQQEHVPVSSLSPDSPALGWLKRLPSVAWPVPLAPLGQLEPLEPPSHCSLLLVVARPPSAPPFLVCHNARSRLPPEQKRSPPTQTVGCVALSSLYEIFFPFLTPLSLSLCGPLPCLLRSSWSFWLYFAIPVAFFFFFFSLTQSAPAPTWFFVFLFSTAPASPDRSTPARRQSIFPVSSIAASLSCLGLPALVLSYPLLLVILPLYLRARKRRETKEPFFLDTPSRPLLRCEPCFSKPLFQTTSSARHGRLCAPVDEAEERQGPCPDARRAEASTDRRDGQQRRVCPP